MMLGIVHRHRLNQLLHPSPSQHVVSNNACHLIVLFVLINLLINDDLNFILNLLSNVLNEHCVRLVKSLLPVRLPVVVHVLHNNNRVETAWVLEHHCQQLNADVCLPRTVLYLRPLQLTNNSVLVFQLLDSLIEDVQRIFTHTQQTNTVTAVTPCRTTLITKGHVFHAQYPLKIEWVFYAQPKRRAMSCRILEVLWSAPPFWHPLTEPLHFHNAWRSSASSLINSNLPSATSIPAESRAWYSLLNVERTLGANRLFLAPLTVHRSSRTLMSGFPNSPVCIFVSCLINREQIMPPLRRPYLPAQSPQVIEGTRRTKDAHLECLWG